ncbi:thioredoxin domain-containing protein [Novosphingobium bradum]|uniref:Thioredoxin domain-containing protein n=1 Tax=Novosphingobium bradum TaxID=1737444 RepID=A0ABV7ISG1_9SPHN
MPFKTVRSALLLATLAPLALGLAGCKKDEAGAKGEAAASAAPLPSVAAPAGKSWADSITQTPEGGYRMGNPDAPIKLVEYGSLTCPHCGEFSEKSAATIRDQWVASGRVSYEFRHYVRDALDLTMGLMTRCGSPEAFFGLTEQVFANQKTLLGSLQGKDAALETAMKAPDAQRFQAIGDVLGLPQFFAARGIPATQAKACLARTDLASQMAKATADQGNQFQIEGTPTFLVNGTKIPTNAWEELKARIEGMGVR